MGKVIKFSRMRISYMELYTYLSESNKQLIDIPTFKKIFIKHINKIKAKADYTDSLNKNILRWIDLHDNNISIPKGAFIKFEDGKFFHFEIGYSTNGKPEAMSTAYRFNYFSEFNKLIYGRSFKIDDRFKVPSTFNPSYFIFGLMNTLLPNNAVSVIELDGSIHEILVSDISYILSEAEFIKLMEEMLFVYVNSVNNLGRINLVAIPDSLIEKCGKINAFYKEKHEAYEKALSANIKENGEVEKKKHTDEKDIKKLYDAYGMLTKMQFALDENGDIRVIFNPSLGKNKTDDASSTVPRCEYIMEGHKITHRPHIIYYKERFLSISQDPQFKLTWGKVAYDDYKRELIRAVMQSPYRLDDLIITDDFVAFNTLPYLHIYVGVHFDGLGPVVELYADQNNIGYETNDYYEYYFNAMVIVNDMLLNKGLKVAPRAKYFNRKVLEQVVKLGFTTTEQIVPNYMHAHRIISTQPTIKISIDNPDKYVPIVKRNITVE